MNINEQVKYLMQGADFGDASIADNMAAELRERLMVKSVLFMSS